MAKKKLIRFADIKTMDCVFEPSMDECLNGGFELRGLWRKNYFENINPIVLELGCGKGEYTIGLAQKYPNKNFIGVDIKGSRIWYGADTVREKGLNNVAFIRTKVEFVQQFFAKDEVDEIWLTFSDPQPAKARKRLTSTLFINRYREVLKKKGLIHLKTDNSMLFDWTLEEIERHSYVLEEMTWDLYGEHLENLEQSTKEILEIQTHYEKMFAEKGFDIKYCKFKI